MSTLPSPSSLLALLTPELALPPGEDNAFVATLRVHGSSNRLQVRNSEQPHDANDLVQIQLMCDEGQVGTLVAYVVTRVSPKVYYAFPPSLPPLLL